MQRDPRPVTVVTHVTRRELRVYRAYGLIGADAPLTDAALRRVRRIRRLHRDLGLSYEAIGLIVPLVERIEALEERLERASR